MAENAINKLTNMFFGRHISQKYIFRKIKLVEEAMKNIRDLEMQNIKPFK